MGGSLSDKTPDEFLQPQFLTEFSLKSGHVHNELVTIDCLLTYLEKIAAFSPCLDLVDPDKKIFLTVAYVSCHQGAILRLWKLLDGPLEHLHKVTRANLRPEFEAEFEPINAKPQTEAMPMAKSSIPFAYALGPPTRHRRPSRR